MTATEKRLPLQRLMAAIVAVGMVAVTSGCGSSSSSSTNSNPAAAAPTTSATSPQSSSPGASSSAPAGAARISTGTVPGLGSVLVNAQGRTLYIFAPDKHSKVTCVSACAAVWPPALLASGQKPLAAGHVKQSLLGSDPDPAGGRVITYAGWPLYTYVTDAAPGQAAGQALNLNGGLWYAISPTGRMITKKP